MVRPDLGPTLPGPGTIVEVLAVVDGDTYVARRGTELYLLKLQDVEAPELGQPFGQEARDALTHQIGGQSIVIWPSRSDGWVIPARTETPGGVDVAQAMLLSGHVWASPTAPAFWRELEARARTAKAGLWKSSNPEPPWEYRKRTTP